METMLIVRTISYLLAILPLLISLFGSMFMIQRKQSLFQEDLDKLSPDQSFIVAQRGGAQALQRQISQYLNVRVLGFPALLLVTLYAAGFTFCDAYIDLKFFDGRYLFFPAKLVSFARPVLFTFLGVYLFNVGAMVRRLYLIDLTEQVFWGAINRLLLSVGIAITVMFIPFHTGAEEVFFAIGFLADVFLQWVLDSAMKIASIGKPKREDLPLRMVRGINLWKEYRLEEEGIENVQHLATANVIELSVKLHYNLSTLLDWIDQAIVISRFGERVTELEAAGLNISAVELAWQSPQNSKGDMAPVQAIARRLNMEPVFIAAQLDSLYEDEYVRNIWTLWQTRPEFQQGKLPFPGLTPAATVAPSDDKP